MWLETDRGYWFKVILVWGLQVIFPDFHCEVFLPNCSGPLGKFWWEMYQIAEYVSEVERREELISLC